MRDICLKDVLSAWFSIYISRCSTRKDVVLPLGTPIKATDGITDIHELHLKNNTNVILGLGAVNRDPAIWGEDACIWKPERWMGRVPDEVAKERLPGVYSGM